MTIWGVLGCSWGLLDPLETVLEAILGPRSRKIEKRSLQVNGRQGLGVDFGSPNGSQNDPKTIQKRVKIQDEKCITFLSLLDPSWTGLEAILDPSWVQNRALALGGARFFENRLFGENEASRPELTRS